MDCDELRKVKAEVFPELQGASEDELRFWRLIEEREDRSDGTTLTTLAYCGHTILWVAGLTETRQYAFCTSCLNAWVEAERKLKDERTRG